MKGMTLLLCVLFTTCFVHEAAAVSPMPVEELKPGQTAILCSVHILYHADRDKGIPAEDFRKRLFFEAAASKAEVLAEAARYAGHWLDRGIVSDVTVSCSYPQ
jgi:hypothetical protein